MIRLIRIHRLSLQARVGITTAERTDPQTLEICAEIEPEADFLSMEDDIGLTVDYAKACDALAEEAARIPRSLIETLAAELAGMLVRDFPARSATVEVRKFILPQTAFVSVSTRVEAPDRGA